MDGRCFMVTVNEKVYSRLERIADKFPTSVESAFLFCALFTLKDIENHRRHIDYYRKYLNQMEKDTEL